MSKNLSELSGRKGLRENLFDELGVLAAPDGAVSKKDMEKLAGEFLMGTANVYGTATFYDFLRPENQGKKVYVCNGSSCLTAGTQDALKAKLGQCYKAEEIGEMCCLGRCHENSSFNTGDKNYSGHDIEEIERIKEGEPQVEDKYNVKSYGTPVLTNPFPDVDDYYKTLSLALSKSRDELLAELKTSGLRGRGGAGFLTAFKYESCKNTPGAQKFVVCNADEGDPGAYSDRYLLEQLPIGR